MGENRHTSGPWEVLQKDFQGTLVGLRNVSAGAYDSACAEQVAWLPKNPFGAGDAHNAYETKSEANARLIAAAPDLLEALRNLLPDAEAAAAAFGYEPTPLLAARAALKKAGG